ncbi:hypothetical protein [Apibacter adventoris]|uniref:DUF4309 domain-containing protein n=1 Tax=Apibacter adventoris TaxID=1679466 RepID=A0A2S8AAL4_9FLAO|nr:hypothetical protein [Apibacter adventoris]PQL91594.1 hypothetical protein C4S77_07215 [Apibacter adventoris]
MHNKLLRLLIIVIAIINIGMFQAQNKKTTQQEKSSQYKKKPLIYGPKSAAKIKELFFLNSQFKLPATISAINSIAGYTSSESIEGAGNIYTWDFTNGFQISAISESGGTVGGNDNIVLVSFNYGNTNSLELGNSISIHKSTLASIQKLYPGKLIKYKSSKIPTYKMENQSKYITFYFNEKNILTSLSISKYDLEI